ncbi:MAG: hypothetical protein ABIS47_09245 [Acidimicrobiales bacterium]
MTSTVILDNEAVQALLSVSHPKHPRALAHVQVIVSRKKKGVPTKVVVPTAVRAEAGWDRTDAGAAFINLLGILDVSLDRASANIAASIVSKHHVSVADAHLGAAISTFAGTGQITVVTSDPADMRTVAGTTDMVIVTL